MTAWPRQSERIDVAYLRLAGAAGISMPLILHRRWSDFGYPVNTGMKGAPQFGIVILFLVSYLTPAMSCMVSDVAMNAEERACCTAMKNRCEQMGMPASHNCCQKLPKSAQGNALVSKAVSPPPLAVAVAWRSVAELMSAKPRIVGPAEHPDYSPPQSPPDSISILRI